MILITNLYNPSKLYKSTRQPTGRTENSKRDKLGLIDLIVQVVGNTATHKLRKSYRRRSLRVCRTHTAILLPVRRYGSDIDANTYWQSNL